MAKIILNFSWTNFKDNWANPEDLIIDFTGCLAKGPHISSGFETIRHSRILARVAERICRLKNLPLDYVVARIYLHEIRRNFGFPDSKLKFRAAPPLLIASSRGYLSYFAHKIIELLKNQISSTKSESSTYASIGNGVLLEKSKRLSHLNFKYSKLDDLNGQMVFGAMHSSFYIHTYAGLVQDGFLASNNALTSEKFRLNGRQLIVRSLLDAELSRNSGIETIVDRKFFIDFPASFSSGSGEISSVLVALNHVGFWTPELYLGATWDVVNWGATFAFQNPEVSVVIRMHPTAKNWFHEGKLAEKQYSSYINSFNLSNLSISSESLRSLDSDIRNADLVISEYSDVSLQAIQAGKLAAFIDFDDRLSMSEAYFNLGFPKVNGNQFQVSAAVLSDSLNTFLINWRDYHWRYANGEHN